MSKQNNLTDFLTGVADAIRTRREYPSSTLINPQDFENQILTIPGGISIDVDFHAVYELPQDPIESDVYLVFDVPGEIPSQLPDISSIDRLNLISLFDYRVGNLYDKNSVNVFSWYTGKENYMIVPTRTLSLGGVVVDFNISNLVSVVNINGEQKKCRVAIHTNNRWVICNYVEVPIIGHVDSVRTSDYFGGILSTIERDITEILGAIDDATISGPTYDLLDSTSLDSYFSGIITTVGDLLESLGPTDEVEEINVDRNL